MISKKAKYALKALKVLTKKFEANQPTLINDIAVEEKIPKKFLEAILLELRNQGILKSQKGKGGGYLLRTPLNEVSVAKVLRIIDGPIAPTPCVSVNFYGKCDDCESEETCSIRPIMLKIRNASLEIYENTTLLDLVLKGAIPL